MSTKLSPEGVKYHTEKFHHLIDKFKSSPETYYQGKASYWLPFIELFEVIRLLDTSKSDSENLNTIKQKFLEVQQHTIPAQFQVS